MRETCPPSSSCTRVTRSSCLAREAGLETCATDSTVVAQHFSPAHWSPDARSPSASTERWCAARRRTPPPVLADRGGTPSGSDRRRPPHEELVGETGRQE